MTSFIPPLASAAVAAAADMTSSNRQPQRSHVCIYSSVQLQRVARVRRTHRKSIVDITDASVGQLAYIHLTRLLIYPARPSNARSNLMCVYWKTFRFPSLAATVVVVCDKH